MTLQRKEVGSSPPPVGSEHEPPLPSLGSPRLRAPRGGRGRTCLLLVEAVEDHLRMHAETRTRQQCPIPGAEGNKTGRRTAGKLGRAQRAVVRWAGNCPRRPCHQEPYLRGYMAGPRGPLTAPSAPRSPHWGCVRAGGCLLPCCAQFPSPAGTPKANPRQLVGPPHLFVCALDGGDRSAPVVTQYVEGHPCAGTAHGHKPILISREDGLT